MLIYVCSPYGGKPENLEKAKEYFKLVVSEGHTPIVPHLYLSNVLDDLIPEDRQIGLKLGIEMLNMCDEMWIFGEISPGMKAEILHFQEIIKNFKRIVRKSR